MVGIMEFIALCKVAHSGRQAYNEFTESAFSPEEETLLVAAAEKGKFYFISVNEVPGGWIRVNGKDFEDDDPATAAMYVEGFRRLCKRGLINYEGGDLFMLTGTGFQKARELRDKAKP